MAEIVSCCARCGDTEHIILKHDEVSVCDDVIACADRQAAIQTQTAERAHAVVYAEGVAAGRAEVLALVRARTETEYAFYQDMKHGRIPYDDRGVFWHEAASDVLDEVLAACGETT